MNTPIRSHSKRRWITFSLAVLITIAVGFSVASIGSPAAATDNGGQVAPTPAEPIVEEARTRPLDGPIETVGTPEDGRAEERSDDEPEETVPMPRVTVGNDGHVRIAMFGDSLAWEARDHFAGAFDGTATPVDVDSATMGGTALCDFSDRIASTLTESEVDALVLAFSGNALTPCMLDELDNPTTGDAHTEAYASPLTAAIDLARQSGTELFLAVAPVSRQDAPEAAALRELYRTVADTDPIVHIVETGDSLTPNGSWTESLPCLDFEDESYGCIDGEIIVRAPDGAHYCPGSGPADHGVTETCERWSSGAYRYAAALAAPVIDAIII